MLCGVVNVARRCCLFINRRLPCRTMTVSSQTHTREKKTANLNPHQVNTRKMQKKIYFCHTQRWLAANSRAISTQVSTSCLVVVCLYDVYNFLMLLFASFTATSSISLWLSNRVRYVPIHIPALL